MARTAAARFELRSAELRGSREGTRFGGEGERKTWCCLWMVCEFCLEGRVMGVGVGVPGGIVVMSLVGRPCCWGCNVVGDAMRPLRYWAIAWIVIVCLVAEMLFSAEVDEVKALEHESGLFGETRSGAPSFTVLMSTTTPLLHVSLDNLFTRSA